MVVRLEHRMSKLGDTASKESIQALAKWIGFRRKHIPAFAKSLAAAIETPSSIQSKSTSTASTDTAATTNRTRQWLYLQILHESIILDSGTSRWERQAEARDILGDVLLEVAKSGCLDWATSKKVETIMIKQWDSLNVFGGPTLIHAIKKQLAAAPSEKTGSSSNTTAAAASDTATASSNGNKTKPASPTRPKSPTPPSSISPKRDRDGASKSPPPPEDDFPPAANDNDDDDDDDDDNNNDQAMVDVASPDPASPPKNSSSSSDKKIDVETPPMSAAATPSKFPLKKEVEYDFEAKNVPFGKVDSKAFIDPCTAIATLQIARDLRNDTAVQLSSLLKTLPEDIKALCEEAGNAPKDDPYELPADKARELSMRTSEKLLDMDLDEQLQNARTFLEIVGNQREARQRLIYLLIRSRCRFGANEAAEAFMKLDQTTMEVRERKGVLLDAMALEGLDFEETKEETDKTKQMEQELAPFAWYKSEAEKEAMSAVEEPATSEEPEAKRAKVGDDSKG